MIAVIFEVQPANGGLERYIDLATELHTHLETIDGFISIERFTSMTNPGKVLSLSFWKDERAIQDWRNLSQHRNAQTEGRNGLFADYRLRVATIIRDYGLKERAEAPTDSRVAHQKCEA